VGIVRVLLAEDEPDLGVAIKRSLTQENYIVDWTKNGIEASDLLDNCWTHYTLAILDWMLPKLSGLELCKRLRSQKNPLPILILTAKDRLEDKVEGLDAGADDYLVKPFKMAELLARLRALYRRSPYIPLQYLQVGSLTLDYGTRTVSCDDSKIELTAKEFQVLEYLMRHPNQIVTRDRVLNQLWEVGAEPVSNVVAAQIRLLRRKLAQYGHESLIETVYGTGYRFKTPNSK